MCADRIWSSVFFIVFTIASSPAWCINQCQGERMLEIGIRIPKKMIDLISGTKSCTLVIRQKLSFWLCYLPFASLIRHQIVDGLHVWSGRRDRLSRLFLLRGDRFSPVVNCPNLCRSMLPIFSFARVCSCLRALIFLRHTLQICCYPSDTSSLWIDF